MKTKKIITLLLVAVLLISTASLIVACKDKMFEVKVDYNAEQGTVSVSPTSDDGKYKEGTELTVTATPKTGFALDTVKLSTDDQAMTPNSDGKFVFTVKEDTTVTVKFKSNSPAPHVCGHVCETCGKCTDATCTDPVCAEKCPGHGTTKQPLASGNYNIVLRDETNNLVWYVTGAIGSKGGLVVNHSDATVAVLTVIYENDKYTLKIGNQYLEAYLNGTYKNMRLVNTPSSDAIEWKWSTEYDTFCATYSDETRYLGGNYYNGQVDNLYDGAVTLATAYYFQNNPVVIHYEKVETASVESVELDRTGEILMLPITGNTISLKVTVNPKNAPQDVEWTSSDQEVATVQNGTVTFAGKKGTTTITATAKGTNKSASVTIDTNIKGDTIENALTVEEAIALMDKMGTSVRFDGGDDHNFYVKGIVKVGSEAKTTGSVLRWNISLLGSDDAEIIVPSVVHLSSISKHEDGWLDGCEVVVCVELMKQTTTYTGQNGEIKSCVFPELEDIVITEAEEGVELKAKYTAQLHATPVPANASLEGLEWISSADDKATVDNTGLVTGIAAGTADITAKVGDVTSRTACTVTVTEPQSGGNKFVYDWSGKLGTSQVDNMFDTEASGDLLSVLNIWSPDQSEITAFTVAGMVKHSNDIYPGIGYDDYYAVEGSVAITTQHAIKKITLRLVAFSTAQMVKLSVNGKEINKEPDNWTGTLSSVFEYTIELDEATNTINISVPNELYNQFVIVGMTLEW